MRKQDYHGKSVVKFGESIGEPLTDESIKEVSRELEHRHADTQAAISGTIKTERFGEMNVVCEKWGLNHPTFRTEEGDRVFLSGDEKPENVRLLFKGAYGDTHRHWGRGFKYPIVYAEFDIHWHRQPECPVCDDLLTYGMLKWDPDGGHDGFMNGWLCDNCLPRGISPEEGIW